MNDIIFSLLSMFESLIFSNSFLAVLFPMNCSYSHQLFNNFSKQKNLFFTLLKALLLSTTISCTRLIQSHYSVGYKKRPCKQDLFSEFQAAVFKAVSSVIC